MVFTKSEFPAPGGWKGAQAHECFVFSKTFHSHGTLGPAFVSSQHAIRAPERGQAHYRLRNLPIRLPAVPELSN